MWTISLYRRTADLASKCLLAGSVISLQDPESLSYLTLDECVPGKLSPLDYYYWIEVLN